MAHLDPLEVNTTAKPLSDEEAALLYEDEFLAYPRRPADDDGSNQQRQ